ncbi:MAG: hypothetical protein IKO55_05150, partial [Kiritimatiellae bacterium]|nr:hypothetical protein [Kiritimatiellia bacterium]
MKKKATTVKKVDLADRVIALVEEARRKVVAAANVALVYTYFEVGRMIVEDEQGGKNRAEYGKELLKDLSRKLTDRFGRGFSVDNLQNMRNLYIAYSTRKIYETPSRKSGGGKSEKRSRKFVHGSKDGKNGDLEIQKISDPFRLSWSHYLVLMRIENPEERRFYEIEAAENGWDLDELKRQFKSSLYERLALSRDKKGIL